MDFELSADLDVAHLVDVIAGIVLAVIVGNLVPDGVGFWSGVVVYAFYSAICHAGRMAGRAHGGEDGIRRSIRRAGVAYAEHGGGE